MAIGAKLTPGLAGKRLHDAADAVPIELRRLVTRIIVDAEGNVVDETPVGAFGILRRGYASEVHIRLNKTTGVLSNPILYHDAVEEGRNPGRMPPIEALVPWVGVKLGVPPEERRSVAFLVARKIGQRGTRGQHMVEEGWARTKRKIRPELDALGVKLVNRIRR